MQYLKGIESYQDSRPSAVTLGKFDGLHRGHEMLIQKIMKHQQEDQVVGIVCAFDMSAFWKKQNKEPDFLMTNEEKAQRLDGRIDYFVDCPFDEAISSMEAESFIKDVLVERFHAKYIVVGDDFHFGYQKKGDYRMLQEYGILYDYQVEVVKKTCYQGREISSSYIKEELNKGNRELADYLLGYKYGNHRKNGEE